MGAGPFIIMMTLILLSMSFVAVPIISDMLSERGRRRRVLTRADEKLYREAAKIIANLLHVNDLEGDLGDVILSSKTNERLQDWLARYRKEVDK